MTTITMQPPAADVSVPTVPRRQMVVQPIHDFDALAEWARSWDVVNEEADEARTGPTSPTDMTAWWQAVYAAYARPNSDHPAASNIAVAVRDSGAAVALAPLVPQGRWQPWREAPGISQLYEPSAFIYRDQAALTRLTDHLATTGTSLVLPRTLADSATVVALERSYRGRGHIVRRAGTGCPYIEIHAEIDTAEALLNKRLRSDLRRGQRNAEKLGAVRYEVVAPVDKAHFAAQFATFLAVESAGWKGDSGTALARDDSMREFFATFGAAATQQGVLRFAWMTIDDAPVAAQLAVESSGRLWLLKIGYDQRYAKCSPGQLLMFETLRWAVDRGLASYEFLGSAADWTRRWTANERETIELAVFARGAKGQLARLVWLANKATRRLRNWCGQRCTS